jgi:hypothetical protein
MFFIKYFSVESKKSTTQLRNELLGKHLKVHDLDFEVVERDGTIKILPHAENDDHIYTLPITKLKLIDKQGGTTIKGVCKPRRIDIGGPYLLMIFITFAVIASLALLKYGEGDYNLSAYILLGISAATYLLLFFRMEKGYFDYIRKIKKWTKDQA